MARHYAPSVGKLPASTAGIKGKAMISHDKKLIPIWSFSVPAVAALLLVANYSLPGISKL
jgi:hypothetical protein